MIPGLARVTQLANPIAPIAKRNIEASQAAAAELGLTVHAFEASSAVELTTAFDAMANAGMQAVLVGASEGLPMQAGDTIAKLALDRHLALCTYSRETFEPGALMSYGTDQVAICRRAAVYVDRSSKARDPANFRSKDQPSSNSSSISRPQRRSASTCQAIFSSLRMK